MMVPGLPPRRCCFLLLVLLCCCFIHGCVSLTEEEIDKERGLTGEEDPVDGSVRVSLADRKVLDGWLTTIFLPVLYIVVFVVALPSNAMALWVFAFRTKKKHPASIYMANLALSDLMFVVWLPLKISYHLNGNDWIYGEPLCKVLVGFFYANMYCSSAFIACISVQRYWGVVHPLARGQRGQNRLTAAVCVCVWAAVWLLTVPLYLYDQTVREKSLNILTCHDVTRPSQKNMAAGYFLTMALLGFVVPSAVCVVAYGLMLRTLRSSMSSSSVTKNRRKAVVLVITVVVMFLLCFTPSNIMLVVHYCLMLAGRTDNMYAFYITTLCLASLNCCVDPFVYYFISEEFRNHVKNTIICRSVRKADRMKVSFSALKNSNKKSATYSSTSDGNTRSTSC